MVLRPLTLLAVLGALVLAAGAGATTVPEPSGPLSGTAAPGDPVFVLTGSGNGHGVGLSQYGALAQARAGRSAADILSFYFPGTTLGTRTPPALRVLVATGAASLAVASTAELTLRDAAGQTRRLPAGTTTLDPSLQLPGETPGAAPLTGPVTLTPAAGALVGVGARTYRGSIEISSDGTTLQAVDVVGLEAYLQSVVPAEVPSTWPEAALEAQAVAARSYALATLLKGKGWDLYPDGRSQQYPGAGAETPATTAAVKATRGKVVLFGSAVATTFYSSSSGGRTQSGLDAFGLDVPYLPAQADPWDAGSPFHAWTARALGGAQLAKALGLKAPVVDVSARFSPSGRVAALTATDGAGHTLALAGAEVRKRLDLRSTAFHLATLRFASAPAAAARGSAVHLNGVVRDAGDAALERLEDDGSWTAVVAKLRPDATGAFDALVRPTRTTTYRLTAAGVPGPELTVPVTGAGA